MKLKIDENDVIERDQMANDKIDELTEYDLNNHLSEGTEYETINQIMSNTNQKNLEPTKGILILN